MLKSVAGTCNHNCSLPCIFEETSFGPCERCWLLHIAECFFEERSCSLKELESLFFHGGGYSF